MQSARCARGQWSRDPTGDLPDLPGMCGWHLDSDLPKRNGPWKQSPVCDDSLSQARNRPSTAPHSSECDDPVVFPAVLQASNPRTTELRCSVQQNRHVDCASVPLTCGDLCLERATSRQVLGSLIVLRVFP